MKNRGVVRGWVFVGGVLLIAAVLIWGIGVVTSFQGGGTEEETEAVGATLVFQRNFAFATIVLAVAAAVLLFGTRRPRMPRWDLAIGLLIALLIGSSLYQLVALQLS